MRRALTCSFRLWGSLMLTRDGEYTKPELRDGERYGILLYKAVQHYFIGMRCIDLY